jgi:phosphatidylglycerophosphatase A
MADQAPDPASHPTTTPQLHQPPLGLPTWHPAYLIATGFGLGHLPKAPGTWASAAALPLAFLVYSLGGPPILLLFAVYLFCLGWWAAHVYVKRRVAKDPSEIVIDEIVAQMMVFIAVPPYWYNLLMGFALFRLADIWKPWPVNWADRRLGGGFGVLFDDVLAALYAAGALWLINTIISFNIANP